MADLPEANFAIDRDREDPSRLVAYHVTPRRNIDAIRQKGLLQRRGERARRLGETVAAIWAFPNREAFEYGCDNWLDEMFGDRSRLALVQIDVTGLAYSQNGYELEINCDIPPERISVVTSDLNSAECAAFFTGAMLERLDGREYAAI